MPRPPRPEDLYSLSVPVEVRISPDASRVAAVVKEVAPGKDGYRLSVWLVPCDGSAPARRLTLGARRDTSPRWSPDGSTLAFLSDRSGVLSAGGAGDEPPGPDGDKDASRHHPGVAAADGRWRGHAADAPARGCRGAGLEPRRQPLVHHLVRDLASPTAPATGPEGRASPGCPDHRPAALPAQWGRLHLRPAAQPVGRGRGRRQRSAADVGYGAGYPAGVEPGRPTHRVRVRSTPGAGPQLAHRRLPRGR